MEHNQAQREAYYAELEALNLSTMSDDELFSLEMKNEDCQCPSCEMEMASLVQEWRVYG